MIHFAEGKHDKFFAIQSADSLSPDDIQKLNWLFNGTLLEAKQLSGVFIGPRKEMVTPWSTNAVEITQNMGIPGLVRIEQFHRVDDGSSFDPMLQVKVKDLNQDIFTIDAKPQAILEVEDIAAYNQKEGLALSPDEVDYLIGLSAKLGRRLTDSEVFGFSQVNSEHCRHKIFNGRFIIDGKEKESSLFQLIKKTSKENPQGIVSAYKDNVAFLQGPKAEQFAPERQDIAAEFETKEYDSVISIKAETHNFPTTVEPFNGAATGAGGEIRDRIGGGKASYPLSGSAVYMTPYSRLTNDRSWEKKVEARPWLYQTPLDLLIKASNGASDFGNKFGQPVISGSVLTFEHQENGKTLGYDKVIMLAGGVGYGKQRDALKDKPKKGDKVVILGGDNYRIGMGGAAVSSVDTGKFSSGIEMNAIQRSNPEMQKRAYNAIRALGESDMNPIVSIHDHGAGGHLNCLSELVEETGGKIDIDALPVGDPTLSAKEISGNESQERMGLVIDEKHIENLQKIAQRERAPMYVVGETTGDDRFTFESSKTGLKNIDLALEDMFGNPPKTIMEDVTVNEKFEPVTYKVSEFRTYLNNVLQLEAVACKDWLTNKVDRSVTGRVAKQQTCGELQLPLNNVGVMALDYRGKNGIATSIGHAPVPSLINEAAGSRLAIAESLTNIVWAPMASGIKSVSLSANWMWPCNNKGEDARLYNAVKAVSDFAVDLGINIPTGKDSLSMVQKYPDGKKVLSPGTVIISAGGNCDNIQQVISPNLAQKNADIVYIDLSSDQFKLGGSVFAQTLNKLGESTPDVKNPAYFKNGFAAVQAAIRKGLILAGHDVSEGGLITALLEMTFADNQSGMHLDLTQFEETDFIKILFSENPALVVQTSKTDDLIQLLANYGVDGLVIGTSNTKRSFNLKTSTDTLALDISELRDTWYKTSYLLDQHQSTQKLATERFENYKKQEIPNILPAGFTGKLAAYGVNASRKNKTGNKAAIIREKGVNGDREMAYVMHLAGFDVKDIHMTDLVSGREDLSDVNFIVFVGGFSNSDVLGSAKGWAGAFLFNDKAKTALDRFYARNDTMSLGVCNGCQLMVELGLITPNHEVKPTMEHNDSGKFESGFIGANVQANQSIMFKSLSGTSLGIWIAHGEGKFKLPEPEKNYNIILKYTQSGYPGNPNGSAFDTAGIASQDGRHVAMMPHLERAFFPWQCGIYEHQGHEVTPWFEAFVNARKWVERIKSNG